MERDPELNGGWSVRGRPRRSLGPLVYALIGAVIGGLLALSLVPYLPFPGLPGYGAAAAAPSGDGAATPPPAEAGRPPGTGNLSVVEVVRRVAPAVVGVVNFRRVVNPWTGRAAVVEASYGTGVIFDPRGYIVTNYHVIEDAVRVEVALADGERVPAEVVAHDDPYSDLAVLKIDPAGRRLAVARFGDSDAMQVGETVVAIGNPKGLDFFQSVTVGVVSGIRQDLFQRLGDRSGYGAESRIFSVIQTDAAINAGNSGGPLVNLRAEVIGINTLKFAGEATEGMGFAIPSNDVRRITADLIEHGYVVRPAVGVGIVNEDVARAQYGVQEGLLVAQVQPGGPADRAGIRQGDVILAVDGTVVNDFATMIKVISAHEVGDTVTLRIRRGSRVFDVSVTLGELRSSSE